jgi:hypothetical protein
MVAQLKCEQPVIWVDTKGIVRCNHDKIALADCPKEGRFKGSFQPDCFTSFRPDRVAIKKDHKLSKENGE